MSFEDGLRVVQRRGEAMQDSMQMPLLRGMVSLLLIDREKAQELRDAASTEGEIQLANFLCPGNIVLSGVNAACEKVATLANDAGGTSGSVSSRWCVPYLDYETSRYQTF